MGYLEQEKIVFLSVKTFVAQLMSSVLLVLCHAFKIQNHTTDGYKNDIRPCYYYYIETKLVHLIENAFLY